MPELPEVETTRRGLLKVIRNNPIKQIIIRQAQLRWCIPTEITTLLPKQHIHKLERRGKYLLFKTDIGTVLIHLGMSGCLRILTKPLEPKKHDHVDIIFANKHYIRYTDPRRFGAILFTSDDPEDHPLLRHLGPEPLSAKFNTDQLYEKSRGRKTTIKQFIMDSKVVVGVGNIYASEALFLAGILPHSAAGDVSKPRYAKLVDSIKTVLQKAIKAGGTTLKDFYNSNGKPGYFSNELQVYGNDQSPCPKCLTKIEKANIGQRSTFYCPRCQTPAC